MKVNLKAIAEIFAGTSKYNNSDKLFLIILFCMNFNDLIEKHKSEIPDEVLKMWNCIEDDEE